MFERLPRELQVAAVRELGRNDLKSFRLVGKQAGDITTPELFKTFHLSPSRNSYHRAQQLSSNKTLSSCIRSVVYHASYVNDEYKEHDEFVIDLMEFDYSAVHCDLHEGNVNIRVNSVTCHCGPSEADYETFSQKYNHDQVAEFYRNYLQEISHNLDQTEDRLFEEEHLPSIIQHLQLKSFQVQ